MTEAGRWLEEERQREEMIRLMVLGDLIKEILLYEPPKREHWWQFWRERV